MLRQHGAQYLLGIRAGWPWDAMERPAGGVYQIPEQANFLDHAAPPFALAISASALANIPSPANSALA
jgi:hypothetical protein